MGFLELDKVNTLELFLTDRGKELMLKQNIVTHIIALKPCILRGFSHFTRLTGG